jgi:L-asparaginase II
VPSVPLVHFTRGSIVESTHYGSIAVADPSGRLVAAAGDPERVTIMRSSAKPFQAMAVLETGVAERFGLTPAEIALFASSHSGEPRHTDAVADLLRRAGLTPAALQTGLHPPVHVPTRMALERAGTAPSPLHHNCSGKHCGMLCACVLQGWDLRTYVRPDHPLQRRVLALVADVSGVPARDIQIGIDGCGVPSFGVPLVAFATAFARLAASQVPAAHSESAVRVRAAMLAHPEMVAGEGRFDTDLMQIAGGRILAKAGAEGCYGVALAEQGLGLALKIEDGGARAAPAAVAAALRRLDALSDDEIDRLGEHARPIVHNYRGEIVGEARADFSLQSGITLSAAGSR